MIFPFSRFTDLLTPGFFLSTCITWCQIFFVFILLGEMIQVLLICFNWVETTNQMNIVEKIIFAHFGWAFF